VAGLALGGVSLVRADCAPATEVAQVLATNVYAGTDLFVWLGQPQGLPTPTALVWIDAGASVSLPITWLVPGVARVRVPPTAAGQGQIVTPPRTPSGTASTFGVSIAAGAPPARVLGPPRSPRLERGEHPIRYSRGLHVDAHFAASSDARHLVARWGSFGSFATLAPGATTTTVFREGSCGSQPVDAAPPSRGATVQLAFIDADGNTSSFVSAVAP